MEEIIARRIAPVQVARLQDLQSRVLRILPKAEPGFEPDVLYSLSQSLPGVLRYVSQDSCLIYLAMRTPPLGETPPISGMLTAIRPPLEEKMWRVYSGRVRLLRHAAQRWVQREGGGNLSALSLDLSEALPMVGLILAMCPEGPAILPSRRGAYLGRICRPSMMPQTGERGLPWLELWTFAEEKDLFRVPALIRRQLLQNVLPDEAAYSSALCLTDRMLCGESCTEKELHSVLPLFENMKQIFSSDAWRSHVEARRKTGDDIPS